MKKQLFWSQDWSQPKTQYVQRFLSMRAAKPLNCRTYPPAHTNYQLVVHGRATIYMGHGGSRGGNRLVNNETNKMVDSFKVGQLALKHGEYEGARSSRSPCSSAQSSGSPPPSAPPRPPAPGRHENKFNIIQKLQNLNNETMQNISIVFGNKLEKMCHLLHLHLRVLMLLLLLRCGNVC